jgi:hypothetical protein
MPAPRPRKTELSRSKIELYLDCPRCFYEDVVSGIKRPGGPPFTLNNAVVRIAPGDAVCGATLWTHHFFQSVTTIFGKAPPLPGLLRNCSSFFS